MRRASLGAMTSSVDVGGELLRCYAVGVSACYQQMLRAGLLSYGKSREDWQRNNRAIRLTEPPALLALDLEWYPDQQILDSARKYEGRPCWRSHWPKEVVFVAFAQTGAGDEWGFAPTLASSGADSPVVYIEHDSDDARFEAPDFESFIYKMSLKSLSDCDHGEDELIDTVTMLRQSVRRTLPYLRESYRESLEEQLENPVHKVTTETFEQEAGKLVAIGKRAHVFLTYPEFAEREARRVIDDPRVDAPLDERGSVLAAERS